MSDQSRTEPSLSLGHAIRVARLRRKLTQHQLADMMRVARSALTQWERNVHRPVNERLARLSEILGCDLSKVDPKSMFLQDRTSAGARNELFQRCDASLLEVMHPLWRPREIMVFASQKSDDPTIDLMITPEIVLRPRVDLFTNRAGATSGVVVQGSGLQPSFDQGALMLLNGSRSFIEGDSVLALGQFANGLRPARFGRFVERQEASITLLHHASGIKLILPPTECEALFQVISAP